MFYLSTFGKVRLKDLQHKRQSISLSSMQNSDIYDNRLPNASLNGIYERTEDQLWPSFQSELKRRGLYHVLDLHFNPLPTPPLSSFRKIAHDDKVIADRIALYDEALKDHILHGEAAPSIDLLKMDPGLIVASESDKTAVKYFHYEMEKQSISANVVLQIFNSFATKSVQHDLAHIIDDPAIHPRNKVFQIQDHFSRQTQRNIAFGGVSPITNRKAPSSTLALDHYSVNYVPVTNLLFPSHLQSSSLEHFVEPRENDRKFQSLEYDYRGSQPNHTKSGSRSNRSRSHRHRLGSCRKNKDSRGERSQRTHRDATSNHDLHVSRGERSKRTYRDPASCHDFQVSRAESTYRGDQSDSELISSYK